MPRGLIVTSQPREDGRLSVIRVERWWNHQVCVLSDGQELRVRYDKAIGLCLQLCQERAEVKVRTWETREDGETVIELIEIYRQAPTEASLAPSGGPPSVPNGGDSGQPF